MIVDSSALVAILREEPDAPTLLRKIVSSSINRISAASYLEAGIVMDRERNPVVSRRLDEFLKEASIQVEPVTEAQAKLARNAYRDFGKGSGHRAQLNFGDCLAYALAVDTGEPLLFKGDDFNHTGIEFA